MHYPYYSRLQDSTMNMNQGNFSLWYNKFIPINNFENCEACGTDNNKESAVEYYFSKYKEMQKSNEVNKMLKKKHLDQTELFKMFSEKYEQIIFSARLISPLITGIGETHPHEVSMVFDHNMGIPYIPASGIKGIVRFAHTIGLIDKIPDGKLIQYDKEGRPCQPHFNDEDDWTDVPELFGTQARRGSVIFLDAYPESVPQLHVDIMNPHYSEYYGDDTNRIPPADYLNPVPIKFLTVAMGTVFIFRALVSKESPELLGKVKEAFNKAITGEGVGAKTAVGYGLFDIFENKEETVAVKVTTQPKVEIKPVNKFISEIKIIKPNDAGRIGSKIDEALKKLESDEDKKIFAQAVKDHMGKAYKTSKAKTKLEPFLG